MPLLRRTNPLFKTRVRRLGCYSVVALGATMAFDHFNYNVVSRSLRTLKTGAYVTYLYKTTEPQSPEELTELHATAARAVRDVCLKNEGLYIKLGQLFTSMNGVIPPVAINILKVLLDKAPRVDVEIIKKTLVTELGAAEANQSEWMRTQPQRLEERERARLGAPSSARDPSAKIPEITLFHNLKIHHAKKQQRANEMKTENSASLVTSAIDPSLAPYFVAFDEVPVASASIAQVHKAVIKDPDTDELVPVAVKVLKPAIRTQIWYDLTCHDILSYALEWSFGIPLTFNNDAVTENLTKETNFYVEAAHTDLLRECFKDRKDIFIPKVYYQYLTDRVMVTEWVDAVKLSETERLQTEIVDAKIASKKTIISTLISAYNDMVFRHGFVNCDPHPANVMVRPHPQHPETIKERQLADKNRFDNAQGASVSVTDGPKVISTSNFPTPPAPQALLTAPRYQMVLIDHGLCVSATETFRYEYILFFKSLLSGNTDEVRKLVKRWGVGDSELFVSFALQKPHDTAKGFREESVPDESVGHHRRGMHGDRKLTSEELADLQQKMKGRMKKLLSDEKLIPKELAFIGRSMNYLRGINKSYGIPVNRLKLTAEGALKASERERMTSVADLELWESCGRNHEIYLQQRKALKLDTFTTELNLKKRQFIEHFVLFMLDMHQMVTAFYNTVLLPIIARGDKERMRRMRAGTLEDMFEAREEQMAEQLWGPSSGATEATKDEESSR